MKRMLLLLVLITVPAVAQVRPTHVVLVFDNTGSFHQWLHVAHAVVERLLKEFYFFMPGCPDDRITFVALNAHPAIVTELRGLELHERVNRAFMEAFRKPDPKKGTDIVGALELAVTAFDRMQDSNKFLFIFSDMKPDPAPQNVRGWIKELSRFDWQKLEGVSIWVFLWESEPVASDFEMRLKENFPVLRNAHFFSPPPTVSSDEGVILGKQTLKGYVDKVLTEFQQEAIRKIKANKKQSTGQGGWGLGLFLVIFLGVMLVILLLAKVTQNRFGGED